MSSTPELTTRDVLQQVDRRLTALEEAVRTQGAEIRAELQAATTGFRSEFQAATTDLRADLQASTTDLRAQIQSLDASRRSDTRWLVGLMLAGWLSMIRMMLPVLLRIT